MAISNVSKTSWRSRLKTTALVVLFTLTCAVLCVAMIPQPVQVIAFCCLLGVSAAVAGLYRRRRLLVVTGCLIVAVAAPADYLVGIVRSWTPRWLGTVRLPVTVTVLDSTTRTPISDAFVTLGHGGSWEFPNDEGRTTSDGRVTLSAVFRTIGTDYFGHKTGHVNLFGHALSVEANGYEPTWQLLYRYTGDRMDLNDAVPPVVVTLQRRKDTGNEERNGHSSKAIPPAE